MRSSGTNCIWYTMSIPGATFVVAEFFCVASFGFEISFTEKKADSIGATFTLLGTWKKETVSVNETLTHTHFSYPIIVPKKQSSCVGLERFVVPEVDNLPRTFVSMHVRINSTQAGIRTVGKG